jgi:hypothetical protein
VAAGGPAGRDLGLAWGQSCNIRSDCHASVSSGRECYSSDPKRLLYCLLSYDAVALLRKKGLKARRLEDGMPEWRLAGLPVET